MQAEQGKGRQTRGKKISYSAGADDSEDSDSDAKPKSAKKKVSKSKWDVGDDTEEEENIDESEEEAFEVINLFDGLVD